MPPKPATDLTQATSIAEAKLERQRKRIEEADAALTAPPAPERRHHGKSRSNRQSESHLNPSPSKPSNTDGGVPVNEVRVNQFRVISRESSLARPISVMSHRTSETATSDMERQDSALTDGGFQVFKGRRGRKNLGDLNAYEDNKPEVRQSTVEAAFDKREIYNVFGNALPGPEFMEENPGSKDGQLQFVQHPNGDVSAHQWSQLRYMWENIGQFSNIRKKIEGQLAADRLKGETASQTLQQNTLAYFRTIAKQREAGAMGLPFGVKEIQAAMPHPTADELPAAPPGIKETTRVQTQSPAQPRTSFDGQDLAIQDLPSRLQIRRSAPDATYRPTEPSNSGYNFRQQSARQDDPFYLASPYHQIYGGYPYQPPQYGLATSRPPMQGTPFAPVNTKPVGLNYDFHFPPAGTSNRMLQVPSRPPNMSYRAPVQSQVDPMSQPSPYNMAYGSVGLQNLQHRGLNAYSTTQTSETSNYHTAAQSESAAPRRRSGTPSGNRASMSDQLWKISETAKERQLSQTNISRTVLYDPYQNPSSSSNESSASALPVSKKSDSLDFATKPATDQVQSGPSNPSLALAPKIHLPIDSPARRNVENNLDESSPDTHWSKRPYDHSTPTMPTTSTTTTTSTTAPPSSHLQATPQTLRAPFFPADRDGTTRRSGLGGTITTPSTGVSMPSSTSKTKEEQMASYDAELLTWWKSGNTFSRQEEFYRSIITSPSFTTSTSTTSPSTRTITNPSLLPAPIGTPSNPKSATTYNPTTTRLLIPVLETLASYIQDPPSKRQDYFSSQWSRTPAPEWAVDRSEGGNDSFYDVVHHDGDEGKGGGGFLPPLRVGRDVRFCRFEEGRRGGSVVGVGSGGGGGMGGGIDRRFLGGFLGR